MKAYLLSLLLLLGVVSGQIHNWGDLLTVTNTSTTYYFPLSGSLTVQSDVPATVSLSLYASLKVQFPTSGVQPLNFMDVAVGFNFSVSPSTAQVSANLTTPALCSTSLVLLTGQYEAGCLQLDTTTSLYNQVDIQSVNLATGIVEFTFPSSGIYVFVAVAPSAYYPAWWGSTHNVPANGVRNYQYPDGLQVTLGSVNQNTISVNYTTTNPYSTSTNGKNIGYFWTVTTQTEAAINGTLHFAYNKTDVTDKGLNADTLHFEYYDDASASWAVENGGSLNQAGLIVSQQTGHFSTWTIADEKSSANVIQLSIFLLVTLVTVLKFL